MAIRRLLDRPLTSTCRWPIEDPTSVTPAGSPQGSGSACSWLLVERYSQTVQDVIDRMDERDTDAAGLGRAVIQSLSYVNANRVDARFLAVIHIYGATAVALLAYDRLDKQPGIGAAADPNSCA